MPDMQNLLGRIVEDSLNEIFIFDAKTYLFVQVNRGGRRNLGYSQEELRSLTPVDIKPEIDQQAFDALVEPLRDGTEDVLSFQTLHRRKDGSDYNVEVSLQLMVDQDPPVYLAIINDITERLQAQANTLESEERLRAAMEGSHDGIYYAQAVRDEDGEIIDFEYTDVNDRGVEITIFTRDEIIGARLNELMPQNIERGMFAKYKQVCDSGVHLEEEFEVSLQDISPSWIHHQIIPVGTDGLVSHVRDISVQKQAQIDLLESAAQTGAIIRSVPAGLITTSYEGVIEMFNEAAEHIFGYSRDDVIGRDVGMLYPEKFANQFTKLRKKYTATKETTYVGKGVQEVQGMHRDGHIFPAELIVDNYEVGGRTHFIASIQDITDRKAAEDQLRRNVDLVEQASDYGKVSVWELDITDDGSDLGGYATIRSMDINTAYTLRDLVGNTHADDRQRLLDFYDQLVTNRPDYFELDRRSLRGDEYIWVGISGCSLGLDELGKKHYIGVTVDIQDRMHLEEEARRQESLVQGIMDNAAIGLLTIRQDGTIETFNNEAENIFGYKANAVIGSHVSL